MTSGGNRSQKATIQMREYLDAQGMQFLGQMRLLAKDVEKENMVRYLIFFQKNLLIRKLGLGG